MRISRVAFAAALARKDLTVKRLSELADLSRVTVSSIKCGKTCSHKTAGRIAHALGVDVTELLEREE